MLRKVLLGVAVVVASGVFVFHEDLRAALSELSRSNAAQRQADFVCRHVAANTVTREQLCSTLLPMIPAFQARFQAIREKDEEWYTKHGWKYYPDVRCDGETFTLEFMGRRFFCRDGSAEYRQ